MGAKKEKAPPTAFSQAKFDEICRRISLGASLLSICAEESMPDRGTFNDWRKRTPELQAQYDRACIDREDRYFEEIIEIADSCRIGTKTTKKANGDVETVEVDMVERAKVQIDARKWALARMNRKKYGDKVETELTGKNGGPIQVVASPLDEAL